ncbi:MAG: hypothetical protein CSA52_00985 [Gammaproteobacteria bacterium]|nr:MAG: hypothetical protein CSB48_08070 [Pseudomonadota bacterium]PIE38872.1 MAG: hypothetical protein CSA52_00985 [Gammaproteobacteria bacterium]
MLHFLIPCTVLTLLGLAAWYLVVKRSAIVGAGPATLVQVLPLGPKSRVLVLELDNEQLVLGDSGSQINLLTCKPVPSRKQVIQAPENSASCAELVNRA